MLRRVKICYGDIVNKNRTIAIASDLRVDGAKSPEIPQKEGVLGSEIAARNRRSLATFHRTLKSQCIIAVSCLGNRAISGVCDIINSSGVQNQEWPRQTKPKKGQFMNFSQGHSGTKVQCESCLFS